MLIQWCRKGVNDAHLPLIFKVCTNMYSVSHEIGIHGFVALCFVCVLLLFMWFIYPYPCLAIQCTKSGLKPNNSLNFSVGAIPSLCCFNWHYTSFNHMSCIVQSLLGDTMDLMSSHRLPWHPAPPHLVSYYSDAIMSAMVSESTGVSSVYSTVCADQRKHQSSASRNRWIPSQRASN